MKIQFTVKVSMESRWIPHFLGMLKYMQMLGNIGSSEKISFYSDGDGDFRPKFEWDIETKTSSPTKDKLGNPMFDAG